MTTGKLDTGLETTSANKSTELIGMRYFQKKKLSMMRHLRTQKIPLVKNIIKVYQTTIPKPKIKKYLKRPRGSRLDRSDKQKMLRPPGIANDRNIMFCGKN